MNRELVISASRFETRVALLEDGRAAELAVERARQRGVVGDIYKGRVTRVLPGMQSAFVDIGFERDAFLYVADVREDWDEFDEVDEVAAEPAEASGGAASIDDLLKEGQEIVVQVVKDVMASKGVRVTTNVSLPGRYLVFTPHASRVGISRRIQDERERERLKTILGRLAEAGGGFIARTAAEGRGEEEFLADRRYLEAVWETIGIRAEKSPAPSLLHRELDLLLRSVRDVGTQDCSAIWVDDEDAYRRVVEFLDQVHASLVSRVRLHRKNTPLFEDFGLEQEIERALRPKVWLPNGGYIVINPTEALVAIDVNTGRYVGKSRLEDTVFATNLAAVREIVRQIRLRDLGGIIVVDFIDMTEEANRQEIFAALEQELKKDRSRNRILKISEFGLVEITRKRSRQSLDRALTRPCPVCGGAGRIKSEQTVALEIRRDVEKLARRLTAGETAVVRAHADVVRLLRAEEWTLIAELEERYRIQVIVRDDPEFDPERFEVEPA
jgi:ribonuclease G